MADQMNTSPRNRRLARAMKPGALGLWGNVTIGLASTAPAYSLAATLGYVVIADGDKAPAMFIVAFIPMLLIAFAYRELNRAARTAAPPSPGGRRHSAGRRLVGRLGAGRVGNHRAGQCGRDRGHLHLPASSAWTSSPRTRH